ncbi:MAG: NusA-like transcription termination signal-binding factor [Candidatus Aenigmarchaeota archaeon]|nr:NusA-like transcription termination signal-binding factor [Candidatus Aenigmarchaeota archaeon]
MKKEFDMKTIGLIGIFEEITRVNVKDCIFDESSVYFLVDEGYAGKAVGKNGINIKKLRQKIQKQIKIFEYNENSEKFASNLVPNNNSVEIKNNKIYISVGAENKGKIIGRNGENIKKIRELLKRNSDINILEIK